MPLPKFRSSFFTLFGSSILIPMLLAAPLAAAPGLLDTSFDVDGKAIVPIDLGGNMFDAARATVIQPDGKIVIVGYAEVMFPNFDFAVVRLTSDGQLDGTFGVGGMVTIAFDRLADGSDFGGSLALQTDGKIVVVGEVEAGVGGDTDFGVARLLSDGSLDSSFGTGGKRTVAFDLGADLADVARGVAIQADGKIVVGGSARVTGSFGDDFAVARLTSAGDLDSTFDSDGKATATFDLGGNNSDRGDALILQADGKVVMAGSAASATVTGDFAAVRFHTDGSLDTTFSTDGKVTIDLRGGGSDAAYDATLDSSGRLVIVGSSGPAGDTAHTFGVVRLTSSGVLDTSFSSDGIAIVDWPGDGVFHTANSVAIDASGGIVVGGSMQVFNNNYDFAALRLLTTGELDTGFGSGGKVRVPFDLGSGDFDVASGMALDAADRVVLIGEVTRAIQGDRDIAVVRLTNSVGCIFADGFETGMTSEWSATVP